MNAIELNMDGLVGPTHNYAGLGLGNLASMANKNLNSNPKLAALEGLKKMKLCHDLGLKQAVIPPAFRPDISAARALGHQGSDEAILNELKESDQKLLCAISSASSMWTANAASISPSADCRDGKVNITIANLQKNIHRCIEAPFNEALFKLIFHDASFFRLHNPLVVNSDEGGANHMRLCSDYGQRGIEIFVYGSEEINAIYAARQNKKASAAIVQQHMILNESGMLVQQSSEAINKGVFHNDVIAVSNKSLLLIHEKAWRSQATVLAELRERFKHLTNTDLLIIEVAEDEISIETAVQSYVFNSQIISIGNRTQILAPSKCKEFPEVVSFLDRQDFDAVHFIDLEQSMRNGGGPACLRLRIELNERALSAMHQGIILTDALYPKLVDWVNKHYRDCLCLDDLSDPHLLTESQLALDELTTILSLKGLYPFQ